MRARTEARQEANTISRFWGNGVGAEPATGSRMYQQAQAAASGAASASASGSYDEAGAGTSKEGGRIANLAARASRASRLWKSMQQLQRSRGRALLLTSSAGGAEGSSR